MQSKSSSFFMTALVAVAASMSISAVSGGDNRRHDSMQVTGNVQAVDVNARAVTVINSRGATEVFRGRQQRAESRQLQMGTKVTGSIQRPVRLTVLDNGSSMPTQAQVGNRIVASVTGLDSQRRPGHGQGHAGWRVAGAGEHAVRAVERQGGYPGVGRDHDSGCREVMGNEPERVRTGPNGHAAVGFLRWPFMRPRPKMASSFAVRGPRPEPGRNRPCSIGRMSERSGLAATRDNQSTSATSRRCNKVHSAQAGWTFLFRRRVMCHGSQCSDHKECKAPNRLADRVLAGRRFGIHAAQSALNARSMSCTSCVGASV